MKKAFTLIELLIVIAILAILAIGVLAAIDPVEQFNRSKDATLINSAAEYKGAVDRFYTRNGSYPTSYAGAYNGSLMASSGVGSINELTATGELKSNFTSGQSALSTVQLNLAGPAAAPVVCVPLASKSFRTNSSAQYNISGGTNSACGNPTSGSVSTCAICYF